MERVVWRGLGVYCACVLHLRNRRTHRAGHGGRTLSFPRQPPLVCVPAHPMSVHLRLGRLPARLQCMPLCRATRCARGSRPTGGAHMRCRHWCVWPSRLGGWQRWHSPSPRASCRCSARTVFVHRTAAGSFIHRNRLVGADGLCAAMAKDARFSLRIFDMRVNVWGCAAYGEVVDLRRPNTRAKRFVASRKAACFAFGVVHAARCPRHGCGCCCYACWWCC